MVSGFEVAEQRPGDRSHAARRAARRFGALKRTHARLEHGHCGIGVAAIDEAFLVALESGFGLFGAVIDITRVEEDRFRGLAELTAQRAAVHKPRRLTPSQRVLLFLCRHGDPPLKSHVRTKKPGTLAPRQKTGIARTALLATCLTWLQAGRPNHHETGLMSPEAPRVKGAVEKAIPLVNPGEKAKLLVTQVPANAKTMTYGAGK